MAQEVVDENQQPELENAINDAKYLNSPSSPEIHKNAPIASSEDSQNQQQEQIDKTAIHAESINPSFTPVDYSAPSHPTHNVLANTSQTSNILADSQMAQRKKPLPIGIYVIAGLSLVSFAISFLDDSKNSGIYTIAMLFYLFLAIGLLLRLEVVRKITMWLSGLIIILSISIMVILFVLQQRLAVLKTNYNNAVSHIDQDKLTVSQKEQLATLQSSMKIQEEQLGHTLLLANIKQSFACVEMLVVIIYLNRPKVKEVFKNQEALSY